MNSRFLFSVLENVLFLTLVSSLGAPMLLHAEGVLKKSAQLPSKTGGAQPTATPVLPGAIPLKYARELIVGGRPVVRPTQIQRIEKGKHIVGRSEMTRGQKEKVIGPSTPRAESSKQCFRLKLPKPFPPQTVRSGGKHPALIVFDSGGKAGSLDTEQRMVIELFTRDGVGISRDLFFAEDWSKALTQGAPGLEVTLSISPGVFKPGSSGPTVQGRSLFSFCTPGKKGKDCETMRCEFQLALSSR